MRRLEKLTPQLLPRPATTIINWGATTTTIANTATIPRLGRSSLVGRLSGSELARIPPSGTAPLPPLPFLGELTEPPRGPGLPLIHGPRF
jgi:hypothetical protein